MTRLRHCSPLFVTWLTLLSAGSLTNSSFAANLVARWQLIEASPPYADTSGNLIPLYWYSTTAAPGTGTSFEGTAAQLISVSAPAISTRLTADSSQLQNDSFGFSFWVNPVNLTGGENLLAKEMPYNNTVSNSSGMAWQVQVGAPGFVRFTVWGNDPTQPSFGSVISSGVLAMQSTSELWYHIAGGYNALTGQMSIFVNGYENDSLNSVPGAHSSDGSPLDIGTVMNGTNVVASAAAAYIQDVQIFNQPLSATDVAFLWDNPGQALPSPLVQRNPLSLLAHWKMIDSTPPYSDFSGNAIPLNLDPATTPPVSVPGIPGIGIAAQLSFQSPGPSTRLTASSPLLQSDSFGFSFWISPNYLQPLNNIITKEMPYNTTVSNRLAWQVQVGPDNGTSNAPLLFTVLGNNPAQRFYGNATSSVTVPLYVNQAGGWIHVAGGYDSMTGALALFVNGVESDSTNSAAGAHSSDGSPLDIGTVRNGTDFVAYSAQAEIDDVQIYNGILSAYEVNYLIANPGQVATNFLAATNFIFSPAYGNSLITFNGSYSGDSYFAEASTDLVTYASVGTTNVAGGSSSTILVSKANLDAVFGPGPRPQMFFRIHAVVPNGASVFNPCTCN